MNLTDADIEDFRRAYREDFGEEVGVAEAREMAQRLMNLYELIAKPPPPGPAPGNFEGA